MSKLLSAWRNLINDNKFLRILSVIIAFVIWLLIVSVAAPVNEKGFSRVPVSVDFAGSVPDRNGLMMLTTDTSLSVNVTVSGKRSALVSLASSDITAQLNLDSVTAAGTYQIPISVLVPNAGISVTDIAPTDYFVIQFAEIATREIPVTVVYKDEYPEGYLEVSHSVYPETVTVSGPKDTVESIAAVTLDLSVSSRRGNYEETGALHVLNGAGMNVERKYLTLSAEEATVSTRMTYEQTLDVSVTAQFPYGGREPYLTFDYSVPSLTLRGNASAIKAMSTVNIGDFRADTAHDGDTVSFVLPDSNDFTYTDAPEDRTVTATVRMPETAVTSFTFSAAELNLMLLLNDGRAFTQEATVTVRTTAADAETLTKDRIVLSLLSADKNGNAVLGCAVTGVSGYCVMEECHVTCSGY